MTESDDDGGGPNFGVIHNKTADGTPCGSEDVYITDNCAVCECSRAIHCFGCGNIDRLLCECEKARA